MSDIATIMTAARHSRVDEFAATRPGYAAGLWVNRALDNMHDAREDELRTDPAALAARSLTISDNAAGALMKIYAFAQLR